MSVTLLSFVLVIGLSLASDTAAPAHLGLLPSLGFSSSVRSVCKPVPSTFSLCYGLGYTDMWLPNLLAHDSLKEAQQQSAVWLPLVSKLCHQDTKKFLCSLLAPVCLPELSGPVSPCRNLCEAVRDGCVPVMSAFGFPWPEMFNCSRFPPGTELCIPLVSGEQEVKVEEVKEDEEVKVEEETLKDSIICDACSLAAEGETDIQEKFCTSPYALKMRLDSVVTVGRDRQLVPTARSRILRWAGGDADKAEGVGGAMAHSTLWLPGGACTCPGLDSEETNERLETSKRESKGGTDRHGAHNDWYLALAEAEEGRLVLTRLIKWTRGDKEMKRFIRGLLKQPCPEQ